MKKHLLFLFSIINVFVSYAQNSDVNVLIRQDTITLKTAEIGNAIPKLLLQAIEKGQLKAIDSWTNKPIPAKEIYTWRMGIDTIDVSNGGDPKYDVVQNKRSADDIKQLRVCQNWYFDGKTNKLFSVIKWIEFLEPDPYYNHKKEREDVDQIPFCRIYY